MGWVDVTEQVDSLLTQPQGAGGGAPNTFGNQAGTNQLDASQAIIGRDKAGKPVYDPVIEAGLKAQINEQAAVSTQASKDRATINEKRRQYRQDLSSFMAVDDVLHQARGEGTERFGAGMKMFIEGIKQDSTLGRATAMHDAARKKLRVQLVRSAGDVGNLNIAEQAAAELLVPGKFDDYGTAELKRAYLQDVGRAVDEEDAGKVKELISKWMQEDSFKNEMTTIKFKGEEYYIPKEKVSEFKKDKGIK
jgi:hypothetical protein